LPFGLKNASFAKDSCPSAATMKTIQASRLRASARRENNSKTGHSAFSVNGEPRSPIRSSKLEVLPPREKLNEKQRTRLAVCEAVIEANLTQFVEVVLMLKEIKDKGLFREYGDFDTYCRVRFDFGRAHSYRMLASAKVIAGLKKLQSSDGKTGKKSPIGDMLLPRNEAQARELARIKEPEKRLKVLKLAVKGKGKMGLNAAAICEAAAKIAPVQTRFKPAPVESIKIDQKIFLGWIETLKSFASDGKTGELVQLLDKAASDKTILAVPD
jgi:hypothetical protein